MHPNTKTQTWWRLLLVLSDPQSTFLSYPMVRPLYTHTHEKTRRKNCGRKITWVWHLTELQCALQRWHCCSIALDYFSPSVLPSFLPSRAPTLPPFHPFPPINYPTFATPSFYQYIFNPPISSSFLIACLLLFYSPLLKPPPLSSFSLFFTLLLFTHLSTPFSLALAPLLRPLPHLFA